MSSGRGRSPCDTGPREQRLDVTCPGTLAAASRRNDGSRAGQNGATCIPEVPVVSLAAGGQMQLTAHTQSTGLDNSSLKRPTGAYSAQLAKEA